MILNSRKPLLAISTLALFATSMALGASTPPKAPKVGEPAPAFEGKNLDGKTVKLSDFKGKYVVLEWHNRECPYVVKHYESKNMQNRQDALTKEGVVWISINTLAPGKERTFTAADTKAYLKATGAHPTHYLLDDGAAIATSYAAKTTPHMFVIDPTGKLIYNGAIDDNDSRKKEDAPLANNYVVAAVATHKAGRTLAGEAATNRPYGCNVKY